MSPENSPSPEQSQNRELLGKSRVKNQAQSLGVINQDGALIPDRVDRIAQQGALGIESTQQQSHNEASFAERERYETENNVTFDNWASQVDAWLQSVREDTDNGNRAVFLKTIGITDDVDAETFYNTYLADGKSKLIDFVDTIEKNATQEQIEEHAEIIKTLGNAFGSDASVVIEYLVHGVRNIKSNKESFKTAIGSGDASDTGTQDSDTEPSDTPEAPPVAPSTESQVLSAEQLEEYPKSANVFCDRVREKLKSDDLESGSIDTGASTTDPSGRRSIPILTDPNTRIAISADTKDQIDNAWFVHESFRPLADSLGLPYVQTAKDNHATLVLQAPQKTGEKTYQITCWDPMTGLYQETKNVAEEFDQDRATSDVDYYKNWWTRNLGYEFVISEKGWEELSKNAYDLRLDADQGLPEPVVEGFNGRLQNDAKNCIPLSLFAAATRYAAKGKEDEIGPLKAYFENNFNLPIYSADRLKSE